MNSKKKTVKKINEEVVATPVATPALPVCEHFTPPGYSSHVTAYVRHGRVMFHDHKYLKKEVVGLIDWLNQLLEAGLVED